MRVAAIKYDEPDRLSLLQDYELERGSLVAADLQHVVHLASRVFDVPIALVSFLEQNKQVFLAKVGLETDETDRDVSFCDHAIREARVMVVSDATLDARFVNNPFVTGAPNIRFYAGAPLLGAEGHAIGALCIIDDKPRATFSSADQVLLSELAAVVLDKLELNRLHKARHVSEARFQSAARASPDGVVCTDGSGCVSFWNAACEQMFGYPKQYAIGMKLQTLISPANHAQALAASWIFAPGSSLLLNKTIELSANRADGTVFPIELSVSERTDDGVRRLNYILRDVTERRANEDRLFKLAHFDALTGLPNRIVLRSRLEALNEASDAACVLSVDLDGFKEVNDTLGHLVGDALLKAVAERLLICSRPIDTVARIGGDEFVMLLPGISDPNKAAVVADRILAAVAECFVFEGQAINISASVGFAIHPTFGQESGDLISNADLALYQAKADGRHCRRMFVPALRERAMQRRIQDFELRGAVEREEFEIFYQPQVRLSDGALLGAEALLRWNHPTRGLLSPAAFLANLDAGPMAAIVGEWVLENACKQAAVWRKAGATDFQIGVNLFSAQFRTGNLTERVSSVLDAVALSPSALELEITESIILKHDDEVTQHLAQLKDLGVGIAFDDYGTGYASLSMLKTVPLTRLKIDRSFVSGIANSPADRAIVHSVLYLGNQFNLDVIAEGVETELQRDLLVEEGCQTAQGYFYGRPMSAAAFSTMMDLMTTKPLSDIAVA